MRERLRHRFAITSGCLLALVIGTTAAAAPVPPPAPDYGWLFDDGSGTTAGAFAGADDGTLTNGAGWSSDTPLGYTGNLSITLDGNDDFVDVPGLATALNGESAFSLSFWVRSTQTGQDRAFFGGTTPGISDDFGARYDAAGWLPGNNGTTNLLKFGLMIDGTNYQYESAGGVQSTSWQHVVYSWESGAGVSVWIDGVLDVPSAISAGLATAAGQISGQTQFLIGDGPKANWQGNIDEVMVWRSALSSDHVEYLSQNSLSPAFTPIPEPGTGTLVGLGLAVLASRRRTLGAARP